MEHANKKALRVSITPKSITVAVASTESGRKSAQIYQAMATGDLNYGEIDGLAGRMVIVDDKWKSFLGKCRRFDERKKTK